MTRSSVTRWRAQPRRRVTGVLVTAARLGYAHWFFGNLYEAVVKVPDRVAAGQEPAAEPAVAGTRGRLRRGSPLRYYLPGIPLIVVAPVAALAAGWDLPGDRRWLTASATCSLVGTAVTAYLVRTVNLRLFFDDQPVTPAERERLLRRWHRLNVVRLAAAGGAWLTAGRVGLRP